MVELLSLCGCAQVDVDGLEGRRDGPTVELLSLWSAGNAQATVGDLLRALSEIERYDILHELQCLIGMTSTCRCVVVVEGFQCSDAVGWAAGRASGP